MRARNRFVRKGLVFGIAFLIIFIAFVGLPMNVSAAGEYSSYFASGEGTSGNPYQISNVYELQNMKYDLSAHYILINNIDASITSTWNSGAGFEPIGSSWPNTFIGAFDGNGFKIKDLYINRPTGAVGLFGDCSFVSIKNVGLEDIKVNGGGVTGGLVGLNRNYASISNCYVTGSVIGGGWTGGLIGHSGDHSIISNCYTTCSVSGGGAVGGLVGHNGNWASLIYYSYATGSVSGSSNVGGLAGACSDNSRIFHSYATGSVSGSSSVGGLVGSLSIETSISNSYATGSVTGTSNVGGLVGYMGYLAFVMNSFWDTETSGQTTSAGGTGKTTAEMKQQATFGWDFTNIWNIYEGYSYPFFRWEELKFAGGVGTVGNPFQISNIYELQNMNLFLDANYILINDIDASSTTSWNGGAGFEPIGKNIEVPGPPDYYGIPFTGSLDGQGYIITDLTINRASESYIGLFGYTSDTVLKDIGFENIVVRGGETIGALVGYNYYGSISNCYVLGNLGGYGEGYQNLGGLVGVNYGSISNCYTIGSVTGNGYGTQYFGGLVGRNYGSITNCFTTGSAGGFGWGGGLVGENAGTINNCYSTRSVSGSWNSGGLAGGNSGTIQNSYATGNVYARFVSGGLTSSNGGSIMNSYATGTVTGWQYVGGLVAMNGGSISNSFATGSASGDYQVGGLAGTNGGSILNSYATGTASGGLVGGLVASNGGLIINSYSTGLVIGNRYFGGLVAMGGGSTLNSFWDIETSGQSTSAGGIGKSTAEMKTKSTFTDAGWDFVNIWYIEQDITYPYHRWPLTNKPPVAVANGPYSANEGSTVIFDASSSFDLDVTNLQYRWDFENDGTWDTTWSSNPTAENTWGDDYSGEVAVQVYDGEYIDIDTTTVEVINVAPTITLEITSSFQEGLPTTFTASSTDIGSDDLTFEWDFGDGSSTVTNIYYNNGISPDPDPSTDGIYPFTATDTVTHTYGDDYVYTLTLEVTDDDIGITIYTITISIENVAPSNIVFTQPLMVNEGESASFQVEATDQGSDDLTFEWDFGDSTTSVTNTYYNDGAKKDKKPSSAGTFPFTATDPVDHIYGDNSEYTITIIVTDDDEASTTYTTTVNVHNVAPTINSFDIIKASDAGTRLIEVELSTQRTFESDITVTFTEDGDPIYYEGELVTLTKTEPIDRFNFDNTKTYEAIYTVQMAEKETITVWLNFMNVVDGTADRSSMKSSSREVFREKKGQNQQRTVDVTSVLNDVESPPGQLIYKFTANVEDSGSDDLTIIWTFGDGSEPVTNTYYNDGLAPDPLNSPLGTFPFMITDEVTHLFKKSNDPYTVTLTVTDDDGDSITEIRDLVV
jgi:hypothetical protein